MEGNNLNIYNEMINEIKINSDNKKIIKKIPTVENFNQNNGNRKNNSKRKFKIKFIYKNTIIKKYNNNRKDTMCIIRNYKYKRKRKI